MTSVAIRWVLLAVIVLAPGPQHRDASAQSLGLDVATRDVPAWMEMWSPLGQRPGSRTYSLPSTGGALPRLLLPPTRVGLLWTAGHAAALPGEVDDERTDFSAAMGRREGEFRRPFDAPVNRALRLSALGWRPVSSRGAMIGRVAVDRESRSPSPWFAGIREYEASPFAVADTSSAPLQRTQIQLDGAAGWRLRDWRIGLGAGYATRDQNSERSEIFRSGREVSTAVTASASRSVAGVSVGMQLGWRIDAGTISLARGVPNSDTRVIELLGIRPVPANFPAPSFFRRHDARAPSISVGLASSSQDAPSTWALQAELGRRSEMYRRMTTPDPPRDRWESRGASATAVYQRLLRGTRTGGLLLTAGGRAETLSGDATIAIRPGIRIYDARDRVLHGEIELRLVPDGTQAWEAVLALGFVNSHRVQADSNATLRADITTSTPRVVAELGRSFARRWHATVGVESALIRPGGSIPAIQSQLESYRLLIEPELAVTAASARSSAANASVRVSVAGRDVWTAFRVEQAQPTTNVGNATQSGAIGRRVSYGIVGGVTLRRNAQSDPTQR